MEYVERTPKIDRVLLGAELGPDKKLHRLFQWPDDVVGFLADDRRLNPECYDRKGRPIDPSTRAPLKMIEEATQDAQGS